MELCVLLIAHVYFSNSELLKLMSDNCTWRELSNTNTECDLLSVRPSWRISSELSMIAIESENKTLPSGDAVILTPSPSPCTPSHVLNVAELQWEVEIVFTLHEMENGIVGEEFRVISCRGRQGVRLSEHEVDIGRT